eukprot:6207104-Pleurochrysis_carterae.AAC.6
MRARARCFFSFAFEGVARDHTLPPDGAAHACVADARPSPSRLGWGAEAWEPSATSPLTISAGP